MQQELFTRGKKRNKISGFANISACGSFSPTEPDYDKLFPSVGASDSFMNSLSVLSGYKESAKKRKINILDTW